MIIIKIIDYIAENMDMPEVTSNISEISVIGTATVRIINFEAIGEYSEDKISVSLSDGYICICGEKLTINVITERFLEISGRLSVITFEEELR